MSDATCVVAHSEVAATLFSAFTGALLAAGGAYLADLRKWRREDATKFDIVRELAYTEFLAQVAKAQFTGWPATALSPTASSSLWLAKARVDLHSDSAVQEAVLALVRIFEKPPETESEARFTAAYSTVMGAFRRRLGIKTDE